MSHKHELRFADLESLVRWLECSHQGQTHLEFLDEDIILGLTAEQDGDRVTDFADPYSESEEYALAKGCATIPPSGAPRAHDPSQDLPPDPRCPAAVGAHSLGSIHAYGMTPVALVVTFSRYAMNPSGYHVGYETWSARFEVYSKASLGVWRNPHKQRDFFLSHFMVSDHFELFDIDCPDVEEPEDEVEEPEDEDGLAELFGVMDNMEQYYPPDKDDLDSEVRGLIDQFFNEPRMWFFTPSGWEFHPNPTRVLQHQLLGHLGAKNCDDPPWHANHSGCRTVAEQWCAAGFTPATAMTWINAGVVWCDPSAASDYRAKNITPEAFAAEVGPCLNGNETTSEDIAL